jgi:hypothetical protein
MIRKTAKEGPMEAPVFPTIICSKCQTHVEPTLDSYNALGEVLLKAVCPRCDVPFEEKNSFGNMIRVASQFFDIRLDFKDVDIKDLEPYGRIQ